jgi:hypothetical protein
MRKQLNLFPANYPGSVHSADSSMQIRCWRRTVRVACVILAVCIATFWLADISGAQTKRPNASGMLTSVEQDGTVIIDQQGYLADTNTRILNVYGRKAKLEDMKLPIRVYFEYFYTSGGPVITLLREVAR